MLLRERGGLLMQAVTLTTAEERALAGGGQGVGEAVRLWRQRQQQQEEGARASTSTTPYGWLLTLVCIASQVGKFFGNRYMWYMVLSVLYIMCFKRVPGFWTRLGTPGVLIVLVMVL